MVAYGRGYQVDAWRGMHNSPYRLFVVLLQEGVMHVADKVQRRIVMYSKDRNGGEILLPSEKGSLDLDVGKAWKMYGMKLNMAGAGSRGKEVPLD